MCCSYSCDDYVMNDHLNPEFNLLREHIQSVQENRIISTTRSGRVIRQQAEPALQHPANIDDEDFAAKHHFRMQMISKGESFF